MVKNMEQEKRIDMFAVDQVADLLISASCANIAFQETSGSEIRVEAEELENGRYFCTLKGKRLEISYDIHKMVFVNIHRKNAKITVYLPKEQIMNHKFENVKFVIGAGDLSIKNIPFSCKSLNAEIGAGKWEAKLLAVSERLYIEIGAGSVKMKKTTAGSLEVDCGAGNCVYKGRVNGNIKINCGVGNCKLYLENEESDFRYAVSSALGKVRVNDNKISAFGTGKMQTGKGTLGTVVLECGMGNIEVETA
jgi:hypothetical protein